MQSQEAMVLRNKVIGVLLRKARLKAGKSLKECAQALHCSSRVISQFEVGRKAISLPQLEVLARLFNIPLRYFWEEEAVFAEEEPLPSEQILLLRRKMIGVLLRQARLQAGLSQEEVAKALECSPGRISRYEFGEQDIPLPHLEALANLLNVPISYFWPEQSQSEQDYLARLNEMPPEVRDFALKPTNESYIRAAMKLSEMPVESLREFASNLLDITY
ncbi:MAG: helix-turn-helix domain-containing protein [Anaerolineae bacterium]